MRLRHYQEEGAAFLRDKGRALLGDTMGLGKTATLITASYGETLVVCPAMLIDSGSWSRELSIWADDPSRFTLVSYSSVHERGGTGKPRPEYAKRWDTVIFDEAHYLKNTKSQRYEACRWLADRSIMAFLATGTPIPNWPQELFGLLTLMYPDEAKPGGTFGSKWRWTEEWFTTLPNRFNPRAIDVGGLKGCMHGPGHVCECYTTFAAANLRDRFLARKQEDVGVELPPLTFERVEVPMTPRQWRAYREMARNQFAKGVNDEEIVAWNSGAKHTIADRMTTGLGLVGEQVTPAESGKFDRLRFDLERRSAPTLVFAHYRASAQLAATVAQEMGLRVNIVTGETASADRLAAVQDFQAGKLDVLVGTLEVLAEGLTLTAADTAIFLEQSWKPSRNEQAAKRIHRLGQTKPCYVLDYVATGPKGQRTLDVGKREDLEAKVDSQVRTLSAARFAALVRGEHVVG